MKSSAALIAVASTAMFLSAGTPANATTAEQAVCSREWRG